MGTDWRGIAAAKSAEAFAADHPHFFLIGGAAPRAPVKPGATLSVSHVTLEQLTKAATSAVLVLPVVKAVATFPSMISIGRTTNNDIVVEDAQISKFHALFRLRDGGLELEDAGSVNGTTVDGVKLQKGQPRVLRGGERVGLGTLQFVLHDSAAAWAALRSRAGER